MNQKNECSIETLNTIQRRFYIELKFEYISEIIAEEAILKEFKKLYLKHAFDSLGSNFRQLYETQLIVVRTLKDNYKVKYGE